MKRHPDKKEPADHLAKQLEDLGGQNAFVRQQVAQLYEAVRQLYGAVTAQCIQLRDSDAAIQEELRRFQSGGPQRAMAGLFSKLFRDLLGHMNQLDDLVHAGSQGERHEAEKPWIEALQAAQGNLEALLKDWGCISVPVKVGDPFDPAIHESAPGDGAPAGPGGTSQQVAQVVRRGWRLGDSTVQFPRVVVG